VVRLEIENTQVDTERSVIVAEKEGELVEMRQAQERRVAKMLAEEQRE